MLPFNDIKRIAVKYVQNFLQNSVTQAPPTTHFASAQKCKKEHEPFYLLNI